ncbi:MAG: DUF5060 domain-containing protein [Bacteroidota bacterium]|nr:DUF5060 domain-containing protein [Bacteroidota bacterium]MDP4237359.1 DUF5060 domain-containing protein [Bacteroidota bacterium]
MMRSAILLSAIFVLGLLSGQTSAMNSVARFKPIEILVPHDERGITNVWDDVTITGLIRSPGGRAFNVGGFYHSKNLWMVRFAPDEIGTWKYQLSISDKNGQSEVIDSFVCINSTEQGFIRLHPSNPKRWIYSATGNLYFAVGFGDCMGAQRDSILADADLLDGGFRPKGYHEGIAWILPYSQYLISYGEAAGFNIYRYSDGNCAYSIVKTISPSGNDYDTLHSRWTDTLFSALRAHGFRIYMTILATPRGNSADNNSMAATKRYAQYCIDRYGSLVDFWELANESNPDSLWISMVANYFHDHDPYHHLVSMSNATPNHPAIDIISPHWYSKEAVENSDQVTADNINAYRQIPKPVIFGEQGDGGWDSLSAMRLRGRIWSSLFNSGTIVFWNSTFAKDCPCNQYLGWEERRYARVLMNYATLLDSGMRQLAPTMIAGFYKVWTLRSPRVEALYIRNDKDVFPKDNLPYVPVDIPIDGEAIWYDVHSGDILHRESITAGMHTLLPPAFQTDIAFLGGAITEPSAEKMFRIDINPRTEELLNVPIQTPQSFSLQITNIGKDTITLIKNWVSSPSKLLSVSIATPFPLQLLPAQSITVPVQYLMNDTGGAAVMLSFLQSESPSWENVAISATGMLKSSVTPAGTSHTDLHIFPDPSNASLKIEYESAEDATVQLVTLEGNLAMEKHAHEGKCTFDVSKLSTGTYQVRVNSASGNNIRSGKVVIRH